MSIGSQLQQIDALAELTETIIALRAQLATATEQVRTLTEERDAARKELGDVFENLDPGSLKAALSEARREQAAAEANARAIAAERDGWVEGWKRVARERDEAQAKLERFVKGTTEEELRIHGLASLTALGNMEHRAEDAEAACAARDEALSAVSDDLEVLNTSDHPDALEACLLHAMETCRVALAAPSPGAELLAQHAAERHALALAVAEAVYFDALSEYLPDGLRANDRKHIATLVAEVEAAR